MLFYLLLLLPLSALAQSGSNSNNVQLSTSLVVETTLGPDRAESVVTRTQVFTITPAPASSAQPTSTGSSGSGSISQSAINGNNTAAATTTTTTTPRNLPTASIDAGQTHSAPIPGAKEGGGIYGPDDDYISAAVALTLNTALLGLAALVGGGFVIML